MATAPDPSFVPPDPRHLSTQSKPSLDEVLSLISSGDIVSFALGLPAPELFKQQELTEAMQRAMKSPLCLQYRSSLDRFKDHVVRLMALRGVHCEPDCVLPTTGAQQASKMMRMDFSLPTTIIGRP